MKEKKRNNKMGGNDMCIGTGQINFPAVLRAAQDTNIEYYYIEDEIREVVKRASKRMVLQRLLKIKRLGAI